ncbi:MAG: glucuronate isomerase [Clostridia bacterium]|nr:glucuronate isomerase [Clostridia bacterium]
MMSFINNDFMLHSETAKQLYNDYAKDLPIIDYHCHLNPQIIAEDYQFRNITDLMLGGDHYKWRQMRSNGVDEKYITGDASDWEKFQKWAETMPYLIGNPLYHWTHLELKRYFNIDKTLSPNTAEEIWNTCNELLAMPEYSAKNLILRSNVAVICTTDDPIDDLRYHQQIKAEGFPVKVLPTFRPDKAVNIDKETFLPYLEALGVSTYDQLVKTLEEKIDYFHANGCRLSDHALDAIPYAEGDPAAVFDKVVKGEPISKEEADCFKTAVMMVCARKYTALGWAMQLHIGAMRNNNTPMYKKLGPDTGFDSINDLCIAEPLSRFMDALETEDCLPKTILYTLNPKDNYVLGTMLGNFQKAPTPGKIQFGSGWWFNDQRDGMEAQMQALANLGLLSRFVGMLTDSRSFVSYPRHEYFRRILCNLIGGWVEKGEYPNDQAALKMIVEGICYNNALHYFGF